MRPIECGLFMRCMYSESRLIRDILSKTFVSGIELVPDGSFYGDWGVISLLCSGV